MMDEPDPGALCAGLRLASAVGDANFVVLDPGAATERPRMDGRPMVSGRYVPCSAIDRPATGDGVRAGTVYRDPLTGLTLLCTLSGAGTPTAYGRELVPAHLTHEAGEAKGRADCVDQRERTPSVADLGLASELLKHGRAVIQLGPGETPILVLATRKGLFAIDDRCPHAGYSLAAGTARRGTIKCPWHGRTYDLRSGRCRWQADIEQLTTHRVWVDRNGHLMLAVTAAPVPENPELQPRCYGCVNDSRRPLAPAAGTASSAAPSENETSWPGTPPRCYTTRSNTAASPWPPPMHIVSSP
jgi:nitrite reductase/ring-hydroxylating ferredoxin subunit